MNLRCYCCGTELGDRFVLVAHEFKEHSTNDRVFVMAVGHEKRADDIGKTLKSQVVVREK